MFRFENPFGIYLLLVLPALILLYVVYRSWRKREIIKLSSSQLFEKLVPNISLWKRNLKFSLLILSLGFLCLAWANPQWGNKKDKVKVKSADVIIVLDISQSMMAEDVSPNRLERAKRFTQSLIRELRGNRIGMIFFAGNAYLQMPLTNDFAAAEIFAQSANTSQAGTQGTAIVEAIRLAERAFDEHLEYLKTLIVITDGENHDSEAVELANEARDKGIVIHTIGVGTEEGAFVPYLERGREQFKRDKSGNPVRSRLNIDLIRDLAEAGGGRSYLIQEGNQIIEQLNSDIDRMGKQEMEQRSFTEYASYFQYFIGLAILFLIVEFLISSSSTKKISKQLFER